MIDPVINESSPNEVKIYSHICDHSIVIFGIRGFCLGFSKTSRVESLDGFRKLVVDKVKFYVHIVFKENHSKEENMKIK